MMPDHDTNPGVYTANQWFHFWEQTKAENDMLRAKVAYLQAELSGLTLELHQLQDLVGGLRAEIDKAREIEGSGDTR